MRKPLALGIAAVCLAGAAAPAIAVAHVQPNKKHPTFTSKISPSKGVKPGTTLTDKAKKTPQANTKYYCIFMVGVPGNRKTVVSDVPSLGTATSSSKHKLSCKKTYQPYTAQNSSTSPVHHCPVSKADKKAGYRCGIALADAATEGLKGYSLAYFTPKK